MHKMSPISSVPIALHIKAARIPARWTVRDEHHPEVRNYDGRVLSHERTDRLFVPQVEKTKWDDVEPEEIEDPLDLRAQLFHAFNANWTEKTALDFLNRAGAWRITNDGLNESWTKGMHTNVSFGHREAAAIRLLPITMDELRKEVEYWYTLLCSLNNPSKLKALFKQAPKAGAVPIDLTLFALDAQFRNTLPVSLEWQGKDPYAVVEAICASELLVAAGWADVVGQAEEQICARCSTRFTWPRKKKHCRWECGHLDAVKKYKRKKALEKKLRQQKKKARKLSR